MAGENNDGGLINNEFAPSDDFKNQFKNVPVEGADFPDPPPAGDDPNKNKGTGDDPKNGIGADDPNKNTPPPPAGDEEKKKQEAELAAKAEEEKIAKMSPEEKEKYLAEKNKAGDDPNKNTPPPPPAPEGKKFEEEFAERFGGKSFEEVQKLIAAAEEPVFANDQIKFFNELAKNGTQIDENYIYQITRDYENMTDPMEILAEKMRQENPKMDDDEIEFELRQKYQMDAWAKEEGEEATDIEKIMSKKMLREADEARDGMIEKRNSLRFIKPKDPVDEQKLAKERLEAQKQFESDVDSKIVPKVPSFKYEFTDKDGNKYGTFDFQIDANANGKVVQTMKAMGSNMDAFWNQFKGENGKFDHVKFYEYQLKAANFDKVAKKAYDDGLALGTENVAKTIKNQDFNQNGKSSGGAEGQRKSFEQAAAESLSKNVV